MIYKVIESVISDIGQGFQKGLVLITNIETKQKEVYCGVTKNKNKEIAEHIIVTQGIKLFPKEPKEDKGIVIIV